MNTIDRDGAGAMLDAIRSAHLQFIANADTRDAFEALLQTLLETTESEFGWIGELVAGEAGATRNGTPRLRTHAVADVHWDARARAWHEGQMPSDADIRGLHAVSAQVMQRWGPVAINDPAAEIVLRDPYVQCKSQSLLGLPLIFGSELIGVAIVADRPGGYASEHFRQLEAFCATCAHLIFAFRENLRRQGAEAALRESEARFRMVADAAPVLIWMAAADGTRFYFNEVWQRFRGRDSGLDDGVGWIEGVHPHDVSRYMSVYRAAFEARTSFSVEYRFLRHDGEYRWLLDRGVPRFDPPGVFAGFIGACSEVTEIKRAENALGDSRAQLAAVIETAMDAIITVDEQQRIMVFNSAAERMFGYEADEIVGAPLENLLPDRFRAIHRSHVEVFKTAGDRPAAMGAARELSALRSNGEEFPIEASISRCHVGGRLLLTVIVRDVSKLRELAQARQAQATAEAANQAKTMFLSRMSHELRTPLNAVLGFAQLLDTDPGQPPTAQQHDQIALIIHAGQHLLAMITDLLDFTRIESGQLRVVRDVLPLASLVRNCLRLVENTAAQYGVTVSCDIGEPTVTARGDAVRMTQVLVNLLTNAIKYNHRGGLVEVSLAHPTPGRVGVEIRDTGIGMDDGQLAHLFEAFNRLGRERSHVDGTGIGLALTRHLTELMGGTITVTSEPGVGSTFTVWLDQTSSESVQALTSV